MKAIYVKEEKKVEKETETSLKYFIYSFDDETDMDGSKNADLQFEKLTTVSDSAFKNACGVKEVCFDESLKTVKKSAFENCEDLELFACKKNEKNKKQQDNIFIKEILTDIKDNFIIEAFAFKRCKNLKTVILPKCKKLVIEKAAFEDCSSLRTVVCSAEEILFTGNPFEDCPESLVFVCSKDSAIERFVRENGYRCVNVQ